MNINYAESVLHTLRRSVIIVAVMEQGTVFGAIVTYNPDIADLRANISAVCRQVEKLIIVDNASKNIADIECAALEFAVEVVRLEKNMGIAYALQEGLERAKDGGFKYYLTMDQDSVFQNGNAVNTLKEGFSLYENAAVIGPVHAAQPEDSDCKKNDFEKTEAVITSGSLCDIRALDGIGGFNVELFIDEVDYELCFRLRRNGKEIYMCRGAVLLHKLGEPIPIRFLRQRRVYFSHSAFRLYYIGRNNEYMKREFREFVDLKQKRKNLFVTKLYIILGDDNKLEKLRALRRGIEDGRKFTTRFAIYAK